jgi:hypothetical protein
MENLYDRLINQLNELIPLIGISRQDVFELIHQNKGLWFPDTAEDLPESYNVYKRQINHSSFILGYSYWEAFLTDLVEMIYLSRPKMLPKKKTINFDEILEASSCEEIIKIMVRKEIYELLYRSIRDIIRYFQEKLQITFSADIIERVVECSYLRNCILHNRGYADKRLGEFPKYIIDQQFELTSSDVHSFGIYLRREAKNLWDQACAKHLDVD